MKVRINGFDIECTPEEFLELTREIGKTGQSGQSIDEIQQLPDDFKPSPYKPNPNFPNDDTWIRHPDVVALYGCRVYSHPLESTTIEYTGETALDANFWEEFNKQKEVDIKEVDMDAKKKAYYEKRKALREKPKDFPPYLDSPKPSKE